MFSHLFVDVSVFKKTSQLTKPNRLSIIAKLKRYIIFNKFWGHINISVYLNSYSLNANCYQQLLSPISAFLSAEIKATSILTLKSEKQKLLKALHPGDKNPFVAFLSFWRRIFGFLLSFRHTPSALFGSNSSVLLINLFAQRRNCFLIP